MATNDDGPVLRIVRRLDAPPEAVFDALVKPETRRRWWYHRRRAQFDLHVEVGEQWIITTQADGMELLATGVYCEVAPPRHLVYTFAMSRLSPNSGTVTIEIAPEGTGSLATFTRSGVDIAGELRDLAPRSKDAREPGWEPGFDALAAALRS